MSRRTGPGKAARPGEKAGGPDTPQREPGCAVTVVEGTVTEVAPQGTGHRVTVAVVRSYEPARGPAEVGFLLGGDTRPDRGGRARVPQMTCRQAGKPLLPR
ncbi:hypothetical protein GCM10023100_51340 [Actinocorallia cavernae]|uniref:Uncharacterized protein n=2 Tax=Actinomycetes TaxID=1760 RepID=A0ABN3LAZ7_9ACTN